MRLTDDLIRRSKRPTKGQALLWDDLVSGFGVRLTPNNTSFVVQWRAPSPGGRFVADTPTGHARPAVLG